MKGFVPVSKANLLAMVNNSRQVLERALAEETAYHILRIQKRERERANTRKWYRLFVLPNPRFEYTDDATIEYANNRDYPLFDCSPFHSLECDYKNSSRWLDRLENIANSENAGEPILVDIKTFDRISMPENYYWVQVTLCYTISPN